MSLLDRFLDKRRLSSGRMLVLHDGKKREENYGDILIPATSIDQEVCVSLLSHMLESSFRRLRVRSSDPPCTIVDRSWNRDLVLHYAFERAAKPWLHVLYCRVCPLHEEDRPLVESSPCDRRRLRRALDSYRFAKPIGEFEVGFLLLRRSRFRMTLDNSDDPRFPMLGTTQSVGYFPAWVWKFAGIGTMKDLPLSTRVAEVEEDVGSLVYGAGRYLLERLPHRLLIDVGALSKARFN